MKLVFGLLLFGLASFGAETASLLNGTPQEKATLAQMLGAAKDASAVDTLAKAALNQDPVVAYAAADALGAVGTDKAADALLKAWGSGSQGALANGMLKCAEARRAAGDAARARMLYEACREKGPVAHKAAALRGLASLEPQPAAAVKPAVQALLRDESELVRLTGIHAAVRDADEAALPLLFDMTFKPGEEGRAATLALAAMSAKGTDAFLYGEMAKEGPERVKAIGLLAARGQPELVLRLCDAELYAVSGANAAAGDAFRTGVRQETFAQALAFAFGPLPSVQRGPLASALASVAQQLPDQARVMREIGDLLAKTEVSSRADMLGLLAGIQTEGARDLLATQAKSDDVELRKAVVRVFSKWSTPLAVPPLLTLAKQDSDRGVKILATRGLLSLVQKPDVGAKSEKLALLAEVAAAAERMEEKKSVYEIVKSIGGKDADAFRKQLAEACGITNVQERAVAAVNAGGGAVGAFEADTGFSGGSAFAVKLEADTTGATDAAPEEVYQSCRFKDMTYTFGGLKAGQVYRLRLHFAETFHERAGGRIFDVSVNGQPVLADYDILAKAGKRMKAVTETVEATADAAGKLAVAFKTKRDQALVNGLELLAPGADSRGQGTEAGGQKPADVK